MKLLISPQKLISVKISSKREIVSDLLQSYFDHFYDAFAKVCLKLATVESRCRQGDCTCNVKWSFFHYWMIVASRIGSLNVNGQKMYAEMYETGLMLYRTQAVISCV